MSQLTDREKIKEDEFARQCRLYGYDKDAPVILRGFYDAGYSIALASILEESNPDEPGEPGKAGDKMSGAIAIHFPVHYDGVSDNAIYDAKLNWIADVDASMLVDELGNKATEIITNARGRFIADAMNTAYQPYADEFLYDKFMEEIVNEFEHICGEYVVPSNLHDSLLSKLETVETLWRETWKLRQTPPDFPDTSLVCPDCGFRNGAHDCLAHQPKEHLESLGLTQKEIDKQLKESFLEELQNCLDATPVVIGGGLHTSVGFLKQVFGSKVCLGGHTWQITCKVCGENKEPELDTIETHCKHCGIPYGQHRSAYCNLIDLHEWESNLKET